MSLELIAASCCNCLRWQTISLFFSHSPKAQHFKYGIFYKVLLVLCQTCFAGVPTLHCIYAYVCMWRMSPIYFYCMAETAKMNLYSCLLAKDECICCYLLCSTQLIRHFCTTFILSFIFIICPKGLVGHGIVGCLCSMFWCW